MDTDVTGASSAPADPIVASPEESYAAAEAATLERLGQRAYKIQPTKADTAPAKPVDQAVSTDALPKPASEPVKKGVKARGAELDTEIADLQEKLRIRAVLREEYAKGLRDDKPAESSPAPAKAATREFERFKAMPGFPQVDDFDDYSDFLTERAVFIADVRHREHVASQQQEQHQKQHGEQLSTMVGKGTAAHDDFEDVLKAADAARFMFPPWISQLVLTHEQGHEIAYALAKDRVADPVAQAAVVTGILGHSQKAPASTVPAVTKAPDPPITLGARPQDKGDPMRSALANGDFSTFESVWLAKKRAATS